MQAVKPRLHSDRVILGDHVQGQTKDEKEKCIKRQGVPQLPQRVF